VSTPPEGTPERKKRDTLLKRLRALKHSPDTEGAHAEADRLLVAYIDDREIRAAYRAIDKWYA